MRYAGAGKYPSPAELRASLTLSPPPAPPGHKRGKGKGKGRGESLLKSIPASLAMPVCREVGTVAFDLA